MSPVAQPFRAAPRPSGIGRGRPSRLRSLEPNASFGQARRSAEGAKAAGRPTRPGLKAGPYLLALLSAAQISPPPPAQTTGAAAQPGSIRGHVAAADTGLPLRKAIVRAVPMDAGSGAIMPARERASTTDADGRFELADLAPGRYNVTAFKTAYVSATWGQTQPMRPGAPIELKPGQTADRIDFSLQRGGVITGRVFDEYGEPLANVDVAAMLVRVVNGKPEPQRSSSASTNDLGEFRIFGLMPGQYYVHATWRRFGLTDPASPDRTGYPETYFPGTTSVAEAQRFTVRAGQTIGDLAMALSPIKTARLEGTIVDADGRPLGGAVINVSRTESASGIASGVVFSYVAGEMSRPDGTFAIAGVVPGEYVLRTQPMPPRKEAALLKLTVGGEDVKDLRLVALPPSTIAGRIAVDPAQAASLPTLLMIMATPVDNPMMAPMQTVRVADDLSFELTSPAVRTRISVMNLPPGWIVRAIRVNAVDVVDEGLDLKPGENITGVDVEVTNKTATLTGLVTNARGDAVKDCTILLFAADSKRWTPGSRYMRTVRSDQDGRFKFGGIVAAEYNVVAVDRLETPGQWSDPEFLQRVSARATAVTVIEGEAKTIDLKVTTGS